MYKEIVEEAKSAARKAAVKYYAEDMAGQDQFPCGFAWLEIYGFDGKKIKGNTKIGKALKAAGIKQNWERIFSIWNPSDHPCQNVYVKEVGARAAAEVFQKYGFDASARSRLD